MLNSGLRLDAARPETFANMHTYAQDIIQARIARGSQTGSLVTKPDGTIDYEQGPVGPQIKKDIGDAVIPLVKSLNAAGKVKEGKQVIDQYAPFLNAADRATLLSDNNEADVNNQAIVALTKLQQDVAAANPNNPDRRVMLSDIDKMKDLSPAVRFKVIEKNDIFNKRQDAEIDRKREIQVTEEFNRLVQRQASPEAYVSEDEWLNDPETKGRIAGMKPSDVNTFRAIIQAPTKSTEVGLTMLNAGDRNGNLYKMSATDQIKMLSNLSKPDRELARSIMRQQSIDFGRSREKDGTLSGTTASSSKNTIMDTIENQMKAYQAKGVKLFNYNERRKQYDNNEYTQDLIKNYSTLVYTDILNAGKSAGNADVQKQIIDKRFSQIVEQAKKDKEEKGFFSSLKFKGVSNEATKSVYPFDGKFRKPKTSLPSSSGADRLQPKDAKPLPQPTTSVEKADNILSNSTLPDKSDKKAWNGIKLYVKLFISNLDELTRISG